MKATITGRGPDEQRGAEWGGTVVPNRWDVTLTRGTRSWTFPYWTGPALRGAPEASDALAAVLMDVGSIAGGEGFEEWAGNLGYDTDSRKAEHAYNEVHAERGKLADLLGLTPAGLDRMIEHRVEGTDEDGFDALARELLR